MTKNEYDTGVDPINAKYDLIRETLQSECSAEEFLEFGCPQCGGKLEVRVNLDGKRFFVRCRADSTHLSMHGKNEAPPEWFKNLPRNGWY